MSVRYSYLKEQFANPEPIFDEIRKLLKTGEFTLGPQLTEFEENFAKLIGTNFAIGVGSGTDAIKISLKALGIGNGDEVITAANTFIATAGAINEIGASPVFVDVNEHFVMDTSKIEAAITPRTKAIVPVHFTGEPVEMDALMEIARKHDLYVVEDACQSILCEHKKRICGTFGNAGAFSLHPLKNLNVWADGGVIVTNCERLADKIRLLRNHGLKNRDEIACFGYNSRLDTIQAIVGNWLLPQAKSITKKRRENAKYFDDNLSKFVDIPKRRDYVKGCYHLYMFHVEHQFRDDLYRFLNSKGVEAKIHYPIPLYQQEGLKHLGYKKGDFPVTDLQARTVISLPVDQHMTREMMDVCITQIGQFFISRDKDGEKRWKDPMYRL